MRGRLPIRREGRGWSQLWLIGGLILLAFGLRAYHLDYQSLWRDEVDALRFALFPLPRLLGTFTQQGWNGPLYFLLLRLWIVGAGQTEFALRFPSLLGGVLIVPLTYALGRRLGSRRLAIMGSLLAAASPYLVWYSQEAKMYALLTAGALISWYLYLRGLEEGGWGTWIGYVVITSVCMYLHLLAALLIPTQGIVFLLQWSRYRHRLHPWLGAMGALTLPYLPFARWEVPLLFSSFQTGHLFYPLEQILAVLLQAFSLGIASLALPQHLSSPLLYGGLTVTLFLSLAGLFLYQDRESLQLLLCWLLLPPVIIYLVSLRLPVFNARYLIWTIPAFLLLLGAGLLAVREQSRLFFILCLVGLLIADAQALWLQSHTPIKSDFRAAAAYVRDHRRPGEPILFLIPYVRYTFEYYYGPSDPWIDAPYTNYSASPTEVDRRMREVVRGQKEVWLVSSESELWDERGLVQEWLESNGHRTDERAFVRVRVTHYVLGDMR